MIILKVAIITIKKAFIKYIFANNLYNLYKVKSENTVPFPT